MKERRKVKIEFGNDRGVALLLTLMILTILVALAFRFHHLVQVNYSAAANLRDEMLAGYTARSGYDLALSLLSEDDPGIDYLQEEWAIFSGSKDRPSLQVNEGRFQYQIVDENRKIAINRLIGQDGNPNDKIYQMVTRLLDRFEIDQEVLDPLLDWLDEDSDRRASGAEDDYYQRQENPYPCKNGPLDTLSELSLVRDYSEWAGKDLASGKALEQYFTTALTDGRININTAERLIIEVLSDEIDEELAQRIVEFREEYERFDTIDDLKKVQGMDEIYDSIKDMITVKSDYFSLKIRGEVFRASSSIFAMVKRSSDKLQLLYYRKY